MYRVYREDNPYPADDNPDAERLKELADVGPAVGDEIASDVVTKDQKKDVKNVTEAASVGSKEIFSGSHLNELIILQGKVGDAVEDRLSEKSEADGTPSTDRTGSEPEKPAKERVSQVWIAHRS